MQGDLNGVGDARLRENAALVAGLQPFDDRLLGDGLAVADAHQLAAGALAGYIDLRVHGEQLLPFEGLDKLEQLLKGAAFLFLQDDQHPVCTAQTQVAQISVRRAALEACSADLALDVLHAQPLELGSHHALQPEGGSGDHGHILKIHVEFNSCPYNHTR